MSAAPLPRVDVSVNTGRFISESIVTLVCTATLPSTANSGETVATTWLSPSGQLRNSSRFSISNSSPVSTRVFRSSVTIANFVPSADNGEYVCNASVIPASTYVVGSSATDRRNLMVSGQS